MPTTRLLPASPFLAKWLPLGALGLLVVASFHMLEHVVQTYQAYVLGWSEHAHGILGRYFDTDWIHLAYNVGFFLALLPFWVQGGDLRSWPFQSFLGGIAAAGYHVVEHSAKTWQSAAMGQDPALGIAGHFGPLIPIHLWINLVVCALVMPHIVTWAMRLRSTPSTAPLPAPPVRAP